MRRILLSLAMTLASDAYAGDCAVRSIPCGARSFAAPAVSYAPAILSLRSVYQPPPIVYQPPPVVFETPVVFQAPLLLPALSAFDYGGYSRSFRSFDYGGYGGFAARSFALDSYAARSFAFDYGAVRSFAPGVNVNVNVGTRGRIPLVGGVLSRINDRRIERNIDRTIRLDRARFNLDQIRFGW